MMTREELIKNIRLKKNFLCIGLDTDLHKIPSKLKNTEDPVFEFNKAIIDATKDHCVAYKPNIAFYERLGSKGWESLRKTLEYIPASHFTIADAKRGDIGNTAEMYAQTFFNTYSFDSVTVSPYMGKDSVQPFLEFDGKWTIILGLTSNPGAADFEQLELAGGIKVYQQVLKTAREWGNKNNMMFVIGANRAEELKEIRAILPDHFLLIPGVGAQGGSLDAIAKASITEETGILINSSRNILYATTGDSFAEGAAEQAYLLHKEMEKYF